MKTLSTIALAALFAGPATLSLTASAAAKDVPAAGPGAAFVLSKQVRQ